MTRTNIAVEPNKHTIVLIAAEVIIINIELIFSTFLKRKLPP